MFGAHAKKILSFFSNEIQSQKNDNTNQQKFFLLPSELLILSILICSWRQLVWWLVKNNDNNNDIPYPIILAAAVVDANMSAATAMTASMRRRSGVWCMVDPFACTRAAAMALWTLTLASSLKFFLGGVRFLRCSDKSGTLHW